MTDYLLDTNVCIAILNGSSATVVDRFEKVAARGASIGVPSVVTFELFYGAAKSTRPQFNEARVRAFLAGPLAVLAFTEEDAAVAGPIRAELAVRGTPIGVYDTLIAGQAKRLGCVLVTANVGEFARVPELRLEDWSLSASGSRAAGRTSAARRTPKKR